MIELRLHTDTGENLPDEFFSQTKRFSSYPETLRLFLHAYIGENGMRPDQEDEAEKRAIKTRELLAAASDELNLPVTPDAATSLLALVDGAVIKARSAYRSLHPESPNGVPTAWTTVDQLYPENQQSSNS